MSTELAFVVLAVFSALSLRRGLAFRRGSNRDFIGFYRSAGRPRIYRNLPLVLPYVAGAVLVLIGIGTTRYALGSPGQFADVALAIVAIVAIFGLPVFGITLAVWSPKWLTPGWLREDDRLVGYEPPAVGWTDRAWLLIAAAAVSIVVYFLIVVIPLIVARVIELHGVS